MRCADHVERMGQMSVACKSLVGKPFGIFKSIWDNGSFMDLREMACGNV
jgi:hypothetical protein